jgi:CO/xanthine dehydrogenase FAD-binding subunit
LKRAPFSCYRARSVPETVARLAGRGDGAKSPAGGQIPVPMMNFRLVRPAAPLDLTWIRAVLAGSIGPLPPTPARVQELATNGGGR